MFSIIAGHVHAAPDPSIPPNFLAYPPYSGFTWEVTHLLPRPKVRLPAKEAVDDSLSRGMEQARPKAWQEESSGAASVSRLSDLDALPGRWGVQIKAMQSASNGDAAYTKGKGLPEAIRLYTAAAVDFHRAHRTIVRPEYDYESTPAQPQGPLNSRQLEALGKAMERFQAVLDLPVEKQASRAVAAAYMLGRCYALRKQSGDVPKAEKAFELTRTLVYSGMPDVDGLAVSSLGEEARLFRAQGDLAETFQLYARQASQGSVVGVESLKWLAQALYQDPQGMAKVEDIPIGQRVLLAYALQVNDDGHVLNYTYSPGQHAPIFYDLYDPRGIRPILAIAKTWPMAKIAWPDRLAALAFRAGDRDFARRLLVGQHSALAWWLQAKLQVAAGKLAEAEASYQRTVAMTGPHETVQNSLSPFNGAAACSEIGQLQRVRGEFIKAIKSHVACKAKYGFQSLDDEIDEYLADRVLTTEELERLVDAYPVSHREPDVESQPYNVTVAILHEVLAKRLVRESRFKEAIHYADPVGDWRRLPDDPSYDTGLSPKLKSQADLISAYALAKQRSIHADAAVKRAQAWYQLALLTRIHYDNINAHESHMHAPDGGPIFPGISSAERQRLKANYTGPDQASLHWYIAREDALKAAKLVPARSQAYVAILCHAAHWMFQAPPVEGRDPHKLYEATYRLYLENGAYVRWGRDFGRRCPDPDFAKAAMPEWRRKLHTYYERAHRHSRESVVVWISGLVLVGSIFGICLFRKRARGK